MASRRLHAVGYAMARRLGGTVVARRHVQLTVVDGVMVATLIESPQLDGRPDLDGRRDLVACRYRVVVTPVGVARAVRRLLALRRLRCAALDFAVDRAGRWWFLEVNPNGRDRDAGRVGNGGRDVRSGLLEGRS